MSEDQREGLYPDWWTPVGVGYCWMVQDERDEDEGDDATLVSVQIGPASAPPDTHRRRLGEVAVCLQLYHGEEYDRPGSEAEPREEVMLVFDRQQWREFFLLGEAILSETDDEVKG